ncbi:MAG: hypothetical protein Kow006_08430 [Gammaproteobacteria bacterium]
MKITLKLFASLAQHLPSNSNANEAVIEVEEGTTPQQILDRYGVPERLAHLVLINGVFVPPESRTTSPLSEGDELSVWPPIAGG